MSHEQTRNSRQLPSQPGCRALRSGPREANKITNEQKYTSIYRPNLELQIKHNRKDKTLI